MVPKIDFACHLAVLLFIAIGIIPANAQRAAERQTPRPSRPNVILITVDTLRADHVGVLGSTKVKTPAIDSLAADGVLYENAVAQVPLTFPSHASILTGTYPFFNGVQDFTSEPLAANFRSVAQAFKDRGYVTAAFVSSFVLDRSFGLARGFDVYYDAFSPESFVAKSMGLVDRPAGETLAKLKQWLRTRPAKPLFLWLHLYDPHSPYSPPEPFRSRYKTDPYSGEVAYVDQQLGRFFAELKRLGIYERSAIVLVSDHGESLGDHAESEHGFFIYRSTSHVPLIVKPAGAVRQGTRLQAAVEAVSIAPTLLSLANIHDQIEGQFQASVLPLRKAQEHPESTAYSETFYPFSSFGWSPLRSLQSSQYQFIDAPMPEFYDHRSDPQQQTNTVDQQRALAATFRERLRQLAAKYAPTAGNGESHGLSPDAVEKLRALGYVAYKSPVSAEAIAKGLPDPKSKIVDLNAILKAADSFENRRFAEGRNLLEDVRRRDPGLYIVPFMLGEAALRERDWETAAKEFERCLSLNPRFDQAMTGAAQALFPLNRADEAKAQLDAAIKINPRNYRALYQLGFMQLSTDPDAAAAALQQVIAIQPNFALAHRDLGMLRFAKKDYAQASAHLENAIRQGVSDIQIFNSAGIAANQIHDTRLAEANYLRALRLDPDYAEAHLNLGMIYQRTDRGALAKKEYATACRLKALLCRFVPR